MKRITIWNGIWLGLLTGLVVTALAYLGFRLFGLPFIPFDILDLETRVLPGNWITAGIDAMVSAIRSLQLGQTSVVAKALEQAASIAQFLALGVLFGIAVVVLARRNRDRAVAGAEIIGLALGALAIGVEAMLGFPNTGVFFSSLWVVLLFVGWGWLMARLLLALNPLPGPLPGQDEERRRFLYLVGAGSFTVLVSALGVSLIRQKPPIPQTGVQGGPQADAANTSGPAQSPSALALDQRIDPVPGTRPEITTNDRFYRIDINTIPPTVDAGAWKLEIGGLIDRPTSLTLDEIRARPSISQAITLECISNPLGGDLISTTRYTGIQLKALLDELGLQSGAQGLYVESVDGFYETVSLADMQDERTLLVYAMNDEPLPVAHGFPLRLYIPNHFGMKQPKWIERMTVVPENRGGYWEDRGWSQQAVPPTTSVIDKLYLPPNQTDTVWVGGIAYAGARGISKVEVQVDDGPWQAAELRDPPVSPLTWVQWRYAWPDVSTGRHTFRVRAYDGAGSLQPVIYSDPHPDGATGIDQVADNF